MPYERLRTHPGRAVRWYFQHLRYRRLLIPRQWQYQRPHGIDRMCLLRADQTYDGRTYANPDEMFKIAENLFAYQPTFARFRRFSGQDGASHRLGGQSVVAASQG